MRETLLVGSHGTVVYNGGTLTAGTLSLLGGGARVLLSAGGEKLLEVGALSIVTSGDSQLDLNDNDMIVRSGTSTAAVAALVASARNTSGSGAWLGSGITSSAARANANHATSLGVISGANYIAAHSSSNFDGFSVAGSDTLVKYTWYGDTDFNGRINFDDYVRTDNGFNNHLTGWFNGDFNYDNQVNFDDYVLIDLAFNTQSGTLDRALAYLDGTDRSADGMGGAALQRVEQHLSEFGGEYASHFLVAVPEPTALALVVALLPLARRRRRRRCSSKGFGTSSACARRS